MRDEKRLTRKEVIYALIEYEINEEELMKVIEKYANQKAVEVLEELRQELISVSKTILWEDEAGRDKYAQEYIVGMQERLNQKNK